MLQRKSLVGIRERMKVSYLFIKLFYLWEKLCFSFCLLDVNCEHFEKLTVLQKPTSCQIHLMCPCRRNLCQLSVLIHVWVSLMTKLVWSYVIHSFLWRLLVLAHLFLLGHFAMLKVTMLASLPKVIERFRTLRKRAIEDTERQSYCNGAHNQIFDFMIHFVTKNKLLDIKSEVCCTILEWWN